MLKVFYDKTTNKRMDVGRLRYWWIIQSLEAYNQHPDLIGCGLKEGTERPTHPKFQEIKKATMLFTMRLAIRCWLEFSKWSPIWKG